jgi:hypothetical protein
VSSTAKKRQNRGRKATHVKFSDFVAEEDMRPQPSMEALEGQEEGIEQAQIQQEESIRD